jgi:hypothetical protein
MVCKALVAYPTKILRKVRSSGSEPQRYILASFSSSALSMLNTKVERSTRRSGAKQSVWDMRLNVSVQGGPVNEADQIRIHKVVRLVTNGQGKH